MVVKIITRVYLAFLKFKMEIQSVEEPQHTVSLGAALIAMKNYEKVLVSETKETEIKPFTS